MDVGDVMAQRLELLRLEHLAGEVLTVLRTAGVDALLLKGPVTNAWLYGGADARSFRDVDVLVRPAQAALTGRVLTAAGFYDLHARLLPVHRPSHERTWTRGGLALDVHTRLAGVPATHGAAAFDVIWAGREPFALQGRAVPAMAPAARAVHLALHAAQSRSDSRALRDLEQGLDLLPPALWVLALDEAAALGCSAAAAAGLRKVSRGQPLAAQLEAGSRPSTDVLLRTRGASIEAQNLWEALSRRPATRAVAALVALVAGAPAAPVPGRTRAAAAGRVVIATIEVAVAAARAVVLGYDRRRFGGRSDGLPRVGHGGRTGRLP